MRNKIKRLNVVCTIKMLELIIDQPNRFTDKVFHNNLEEIILNRSSIIFIGDKNALEKDNPKYKKLWKNQGGTEIIEFYPNFRNELFEFSDAILLIDESADKCKMYREKYGVACFGYEDINDARYLFAHEKIAIGEKAQSASIKAFADFSRFKHHFKNIWIIDNYFPFKEINNLKDIDFFKLLKEMTYENQNITVHICVAQVELDKKIEKIDIKILENRFKEIFGNNCSVKIFKSPANHDRNILTDYLWINSGDSFEKYKLKNGEVLRTGNFTTLSVTGVANKSISFDDSDSPSNDFCWAIEGYKHIHENIYKKNKENVMLGSYVVIDK